MVELLGQMIRLPFSVMGYTLGVMSQTADGLGAIAAAGLGARRGGPAPAAGDFRQPGPQAGEPQYPTTRTTAAVAPAAPWPPEERKMADRNLNDNMVKLVEYTIVCVEREKERPLMGGMQLFVETDDLTGDAFSNARIAEWISANSQEASQIKPDTLRVYYNVLERWPKEELKYEERRLAAGSEQITVLREIRDRLGNI